MSISTMRQKLGNDQRGIVSIIITMIFVIILTLIVLGFAQLSRREQRQALDRQLSTQAQYAAESGVNVAQKHLKDYPEYEKANCGEDLSGAAQALRGYNATLDTTGNTTITCLLIKNQNPYQQYNNVVINSSTVGYISTTNNISELSFSWSDSAGTATGTTPPAGLPLPSAWGSNIGMLRIDLVNLKDGSSIRNGAFTAFLKPSDVLASAPSLAFTPGNNNANGAITNAYCNGGTCSVKITGLTALSSKKFAVRMQGIYRSNNVKVEGIDTSSTDLVFTGQPEIDVTAKASDVLRRVRVRTTISPLADKLTVFPEFPVDSAGGICKQIKVAPTPAGGTNPSQDLCAATPSGAFVPPTYTNVPPPTEDDLNGRADFNNGCLSCSSGTTEPVNAQTQYYYDGPNDPARWVLDLQNITRQSGLSNQSCVWVVTEPVHNLRRDYNNTACQYADRLLINDLPNYNECLVYTVSLRVTFSNGTVDERTKTYTTPKNNSLYNGGTQFTGPCAP